MDAVSAEGRAASQLLAQKEALARDITIALFTEMPELDTRYGPKGRVKCEEDMRYTVEHLMPAVDLGDPTLFTRYIEWMDSLLRARNVTTHELIRCLEHMDALVHERFASDEAAAVSRPIRAGLAVLTRSPESVP